MKSFASRVSMAVALFALLGVPASAAPQTKAQQGCLTKAGKAAEKVAAAQAKENQKCLKAAGKGKLGDSHLFECTRSDAKGKVAKQTAKLASAADKSCTGAGAPEFGTPAGGAAAAAGPMRRSELGALDDLLSPSFGVAAVECATDGAACRCQQKLQKAVDKLTSASRKAYAKCKKQALASGKEPFAAGAASAVELSACIDDPGAVGSLASDPKKVAKARAKLGSEAGKHCADVVGEPFPGWCIGLRGVALGDCLDERARCRVCFGLTLAEGLASDCDLFDDGVDNQSCPLLSPMLMETVNIDSSAEPAETPGTAGVTVTNPKLIAQFGGDTFDLNHARYTRFAFRNPPSDPPDAILILIPGFEGGAGSMKPLAENLLVRAATHTGQTLEVWLYDRRTNQLEDSAGLDLAETLLDPLIALDWLYGGELGLVLHPELAAGPNRRAEIYNPQDDIPFLANWTPQVFARDIDAVVEAALATARDGNVFLGGHSAGTGFTARYAATDFDQSGAGPVDPGYAKLRGLVLLEGGGGSSAGEPPTEEDLDRIEARFDGGLFGAVRDDAERCVDGTTPCTVATEDVDCSAFANTKCTEPTPAFAVSALLNVRILASSEPGSIQAMTDPDGGQVVLQADQGAPGNNAINQVDDLGVLAIPSVLPPATAQGALGSFLDDDGLVAAGAAFVATSLGAAGPVVDGLVTWLDLDEASAIPPDALPDNGPAPTDESVIWGQEAEVVRMDRMATALFAGGTNFVDWYFPSSGLSVTSGLPGLDSTALSVGRGRRDIENLTEAANVDIPVIGFGGSNGLAETPLSFLAFAQSIGTCLAPSCDGTPRVVDETNPSVAFPTLGGVAGGYEVHISEGYAHVDVVAAEDFPGNEVIAPLADFMLRNSE